MAKVLKLVDVAHVAPLDCLRRERRVKMNMQAYLPVETARFLTFLQGRLANYVEWHRQWQEALDPVRFFDQVFAATPSAAK